METMKDMKTIESVKTFLDRVVDATFDEEKQQKWVKCCIYTFIAYMLFQVIRSII